MIRQGSIRALGKHGRGFIAGDAAIAALRVDENSRARLLEAGFNDPIDVGQSVLPSAHLGRAATFNAEGREVVHDDQPMETIYRTAEWTHEQWNGPYTETVTDIVERPYQRYPRSYIDPPSVELTVKQAENGTLFVCGPNRTIGREDDALIHDVNLILNIVGECELLAQNLVTPIRGNIRRLNWNVLPQGHYPWADLKPRIAPTIERMTDSARPVIEHRLEIVSRYPHEFVAIGQAGFAGYVVFGFPALGIFVLECVHDGNATYIFGQDWEGLSRLTKAEILTERLQLHRIIHARNWNLRLGEIMREHGY
jgi:hypothetical protein